MLKKTFYTVFALGAMITIGIVASGFISADTATETAVETTAETPTPLAGGRWIGGKIYHGEMTNLGTGGWAVSKQGTGNYTITSNSGKIKFGMAVAINDVKVDAEATYVGKLQVHTKTSDLRQFKDGYFSFVAYVED